jgi:CheY-like chemotaxis protein
MMTNSVNLLAHTDAPRRTGASPATTQKVAIVNGSPNVLSLAENVISAGHYDVIFVESVGHAYSHIKRVQPDLVILCIHFDEVETLQVLSMLKLDEETRGIPVLTYTVDYETQGEEEDEEPDVSEMRGFATEPGIRMN